jgi:hypothetical protein
VIKSTSYLIIGAILAVIAYTASIFYVGSDYGEAKATKVLNKHIAAQQEAVIQANLKRANSEALLTAINNEHEKTLTKVRNEYEQNIADSNRDHAVRLQQLETRERSYQRMSQSTDAERRALADTATELDRTLTEGRYLVGQLRQTLVLRDKQLIEIGVQVRAERNIGK